MVYTRAGPSFCSSVQPQSTFSVTVSLSSKLSPFKHSRFQLLPFSPRLLLSYLNSLFVDQPFALSSLPPSSLTTAVVKVPSSIALSPSQSPPTPDPFPADAFLPLEYQTLVRYFLVSNLLYRMPSALFSLVVWLGLSSPLVL